MIYQNFPGETFSLGFQRGALKFYFKWAIYGGFFNFGRVFRLGGIFCACWLKTAFFGVRTNFAGREDVENVVTKGVCGRSNKKA